MARKFSNLNPVPLFGQYTDPYADRRGTGPLRPEAAPKAAAPDYLRNFPDDGLHFGWLGHSSVFLHLGGKAILIDPVLCRNTSPIPGLGPRRFPGTEWSPEQLPKIDLVLITHSHYDHLDRFAIRKLDGQVGGYIVPAGVGAILRRWGIPREKITELEWYVEFRQDDLTIALTPSQHGSARSPFDQNETLWGSFVLKTSRFTVFDTGDGGFGDHFQEIAARYGAPDLAIMECGQYNVRWHGVHMFPEESAQAAAILGAKLAVPVHWGTYVLSDHAWDDPPKRFARRAEELGVPYRLPERNEIVEIKETENSEK